MAYSAEVKRGLRFLLSVLESVGYPSNTTIDKIIFKKEGGKVSPVFSENSPTVEEILNADIDLVYDYDPNIELAGDEANAMWEYGNEGTIYFIESPDGNGRIALDQNGVKPIKVDGKSVLSNEISALNKTKEIVSALLATFQEGENGQLTAVNADLSNAEIWSRLMQKDADGNYQPLSMDTSKFASDMMQDRLQAAADMSKIIKGNNLYLRDADNTISKVEMKPDGSLYRGEYDRDSLVDFFEREKPQFPDRHGSVAMFFMRIVQAIGIHWFDDEIAEQEEVELLREEAESQVAQNADKYAADRRQLVKTIKADSAKDIGMDKMLSPDWKALNAMAITMLDPDSQLGKMIEQKKGLAQSYAVIGMFAGALSGENAPDKARQLLDGLTSGKKVWEDPEMNEFLQQGFKKYDAAMKAFEGTKDAFNANPLKELLYDAVNNMAIYAGNLVPLDNRAIMLSKVAKEFMNYANKVPVLKHTFDKNVDAVRGLLTLEQVVAKGLKAQCNLANKSSNTEELYQDMTYYLAYKTVEQIVRADNAYNQQHKDRVTDLPANAPTFIQMLGHFGPDSFLKLFKHSEYLNKNWLVDNMNPEPGKAKYKEDIDTFCELARGGYYEGNNAKICQIALGAAKELANMYANVPSDADATQVTVYRSHQYTYQRPQKVAVRVDAVSPEELSKEELEQAVLNEGAEKTAAINKGERPNSPEASFLGRH